MNGEPSCNRIEGEHVIEVEVDSLFIFSQEMVESSVGSDGQKPIHTLVNLCVDRTFRDRLVSLGVLLDFLNE